MAIPVEAIKKVEKVNFDLHFSKKDKVRFSNLLENQFEIFLKNDFIDFYVDVKATRDNSSP